MVLRDRDISNRFDRSAEKRKQNRADAPEEEEGPRIEPVETIRSEKESVGRNDPCPCGSGRKYKKCCGSK